MSKKKLMRRMSHRMSHKVSDEVKHVVKSENDLLLLIKMSEPMDT